jgi:hypothetical protein
MKTIYFLIIFLIMAFSSLGQVSRDNRSTSASIDTIGPCNPNAIFVELNNKPQYNNGLSSLESEMDAVYKPDINIYGTVFVQFVVNCKGKVSGIKVLRGLNSETDSKIANEIMLLQNWKPGYQQVPVDYLMRLSIGIKNSKITITETK